MQIQAIVRYLRESAGITKLTAERLRQLQKTLRVMKLAALLIVVASLHVSAKGISQTVTYAAKNASLQTIFEAVKAQTGFVFFYKPGDLRQTKPVTVQAQNLPLREFLQQALKGQPVEFLIENQTIVIRTKTMETPKTSPEIVLAEEKVFMEVKGTLVNADTREPLFAATVVVKGSQTMALTDKAGNFFIQAKEGDVLVVSYVGFQNKEIKVTGALLGIVRLAPAVSTLDESVVQAYGVTSRRLNTGNITKVSGEELNRAPVTNPLAALQGRVPGMVITQSSGVAGSAFKVQIRGRTQVDQTYGASDEPLYIIDGIPFATGNTNLNRMSSAIAPTTTTLGGLSPFSTINMADIESIEVLKDADATAIYGSRGASGVVIITTRRGKSGTTQFNINVNQGASKAKLPDMLSTKEYVQMRTEAFANDNKVMTNTNAYDLKLWDTTRDNNLAKQLIGGTSQFTSAQASVSGGSTLVNYVFGGGYNRETSVFPDPKPNTRGAGHFSITSRSADQRFNITLKANYTSSRNETISSDLANKITLPPNYLLYDSAGKVAWNEKGIVNDNPLAALLQKYTAKTDNMMANLIMSYAIIKDLTVRVSGGYNTIRTDELKITPRASNNPTDLSKLGVTFFGNSNFKSWIVEPQAEYTHTRGKGRFTALVGGSYQQQHSNGYNFSINNYTSDDFLGTLIGVSAVGFSNPSSSENEYKYMGFFTRLNYNYDGKYLVNLSGRRDGSSRFGPEYRFSNFGAIGAAWIFTSERFMKPYTWLSFGKIRASYGVTGNDQIGDYKYIDAYTVNAFAPTYRDSTALVPSSLFKPDLHWERTAKLEFGLELGFLNDRFLINASYYRNRTSDPLVSYPLPGTTGFTSIAANLKDVIVQNTGLELMLTSTNIRTRNVEWTTSFNITLPKNKLIRFPGLEQSSYANSYRVGKPLNLRVTAEFMGVDPQTGLYVVKDRDNSKTYNSPADLAPMLDTDPNYYGGLQNRVRYRQFDMEVFFQYHSAMSLNWRNALATGIPIGGLINVPDVVWNRWQKTGDITDVQKFTTNASASNSLQGNTAATYSNINYSNSSYWRLRNLNFGWTMPANWAKRVKMNTVRLFVLTQNLFTWSPYKAGDPEITVISRVPPLRTVTAGFQLNF